MLNSKTDKQIKRYLTKISNECKISVTNESIHYFVPYGNGTLKIRFAAHSTPTFQDAIDIIKITEDLYYVNVIKKIQYSVKADDIIVFLKSLLLVGIKFFKLLQNYQDTCKKAVEKSNKLQQSYENKIKKIDMDFIEQVWTEVEETKKENCILKDENQKLKYKLTKSTSKIQETKDLVNKLQQVIKEL